MRQYPCTFNRAVVFLKPMNIVARFSGSESAGGRTAPVAKIDFDLFVHEGAAGAGDCSAARDVLRASSPAPAIGSGIHADRCGCGFCLHFDTDRRDKWIEVYQNMELAKNGAIAEKDSYIRELLRKVRAPITGYAVQVGESSGLYGTIG